MLAATVIRNVFLGGSRDYMVETADGTQLRVLTPARKILRRAAACRSACRSTAAGFWKGNRRQHCNQAGSIAQTITATTKQEFTIGRSRNAHTSVSRRRVLKGTTAVAASAVFASPLRAAAPAAEAITPALIEAAKKEGKLAFYTAMDLAVRPAAGQDVRGEIPGHLRARRALRRRAHLHAHRPGVLEQHQRRRRGEHRRPAHCIVWKRNQWLAPYCPRTSRSTSPRTYYDPDGLHVTTRILVSPIAYNTNLVKKEEAPKSFADLLDPKWAGKIVKAHPGLQRHDHERDVPDRARSRLGLSREARQAECHAGAVGDRHAQEDFAGRAGGDGRRRRLPASSATRRRASRSTSFTRRRARRSRRPERRVQGRAQSECRAPVPELDAFARGPAAHRRRRLSVFGPRPDRGEDGRPRRSRTSS